MKSSKSACVAFGIFFLASAAKAEEWSLVQERDGVRIYSTAAPSDHPDAYTYRGVTTVKATIDKVRKIHDDAATCVVFSEEACSAQMLLKQEGDRKWIYSRLRLPFPQWTRDVVVLMTTATNADGSITRSLEALPDYIPRDDSNYVRIDHFSGRWKFTPRGSDEVEVQYEETFSLNGPTSLPKSSLANDVYGVLYSLKSRAEL